MVGRPHRDRGGRHPLSATPRRPATTLVLAGVTAVYLAAVGWITLGPRPYDDSTGDLIGSVLAWLAAWPPTSWITFDVVEFGANVAMFIPLGILCALWFGRRAAWIAPLAGLAVSALIELSQALWLPTRTADARDLVANTLGAAIGMLVMAAIGARGDISPTPRPPGRRGRR